VIKTILLLGKFLAASTGANHHADLAQFVASHSKWVDSGGFDRLLHRGDRQRRHAGHMLTVLRRDVILRAKILHFAGDLHVEIGGVESRDRAYAAAAGLGGIPEFPGSDSVGADHTDSRNDDAAKHSDQKETGERSPESE
jgi:hypothetical protein